MASAAMLRSAARSLRLRQPLEPERCLLARRFLSSSSSSVPTERHVCSPTSNKPLKGSMPQKGQVNEKTGDVYKRLLMKIDKVCGDLDEHARLLKQIEVQIEENNKNRGVIDLTPYVVTICNENMITSEENIDGVMDMVLLRSGFDSQASLVVVSTRKWTIKFWSEQGSRLSKGFSEDGMTMVEWAQAVTNKANLEVNKASTTLITFISAICKHTSFQKSQVHNRLPCHSGGQR